MSKKLILGLCLAFSLGLTTGCTNRNNEEIAPTVNIEDVLLEESTQENTEVSKVVEYDGLTLQSSTEEILDFLYGEDENMYTAAEKMIGTQLIDFEFEDIKGNISSVKSLNEKEGGFVLELMASWCSTCKELEPSLKEYREKSSFPVLSVSFDESRDELNSSDTTIDTSHVNVLTSEINLVDVYNLEYIPSLYFVDEEGVIQFVMIGNTDVETLQYLTSKFLG